MRFVKFVALTIVVCSTLIGCAPILKSSSLVNDEMNIRRPMTSDSPRYKIALVMKTLTNPFFVNMEAGARKAEEEYGIELIVRTGAQETSIEQQIQIVENFIQHKVDAIVIAPGSSTDLVQVLKKAQDAGIKIVNIDNKLDEKECKARGLKNVPFISIKNDEAAYLSVKAITNKASAPCEAVIIEGIQDAENSKLRVAGAKKAFEEAGITIVDSQSANWKIDEAYNLAKALFTRHPKIQLVFCANDMMALGVIQYLKEINRKDVLIAGFDDLNDAEQAIQDGWLQVTINQQADLQGYKGVETALKMIKGQSVDELTYAPIRVVTKDSLDQ